MSNTAELTLEQSRAGMQRTTIWSRGHTFFFGLVFWSPPLVHLDDNCATHHACPQPQVAIIKIDIWLNTRVHHWGEGLVFMLWRKHSNFHIEALHLAGDKYNLYHFAEI